MEKKTGLQRISLHIISTLCITIGIFTPGWYQQETREKGGRKLLISVHKGLWYFRNCTANHGCTVYSYYQKYMDTLSKDPKSDIGITYAAQLGDGIVSLLALILSIVCAITMTMVLSKTQRHMQVKYTFISFILIVIINTILWIEIGFHSAESAARTRYYKEKDYENVFFPYSIFLTAIGSAIQMAIGFFMFRTLWRKMTELNFSPSTEIELAVNRQQSGITSETAKNGTTSRSMSVIS